jgi:YidC/Oxa1 family membrane protein insertase
MLTALVVAPATSMVLWVWDPIWNPYVDLIKWVLDGLAGWLHSGGLAIIAFTIIIKTLILPLTVQSIRSSKAMQELQPKIKELQKKYGKDRQRMSQETMRLYSEHRVNPMAGCLPMLLQIPIFFGLYQAIMGLSNSGVGWWNEPFLWLPNLAKPDPYHILPILAAAFQFVQTRMMRPYKQGPITDPQQAMMNSMMNFMPLTVIFFGWGFAAGPVLYWATQSVYSVVQQWLITGWGSLREWVPWLPEMPEHRRLGYRPPRAADDPVVVSGERGHLGGFSGWLQRWMEDKTAERLEMRAQHKAARDGAAADAGGSEGGGSEGSADAVTVKTGVTRNGSRRGRAATANGARRNGAGEQASGAEGERTGGSRAVVIQRKAAPDKVSGSNQG